MAQQTGQSQSELIRQAIDLLCKSAKNKSNDRLQLMRSARGIWADRDDSEFIAIRKSMDRDFE